MSDLEDVVAPRLEFDQGDQGGSANLTYLPLAGRCARLVGLIDQQPKPRQDPEKVLSNQAVCPS